MTYLKTHKQFDELTTVCGKDLASKAHAAKVCRDNMNDVTCGTCKKIMLVFKTDHYNRPRRIKRKCLF